MPATTLATRALLRLSGEDVRGFLQGLVTNDVALLAPNEPLWAGLLSPQGKCLFDFVLWADGDDVLLDCERDAAADLAKRLALYRLRRPITITPEADLAVHWSPTPLRLSLSTPSSSLPGAEKEKEDLRQAQAELGGVFAPHDPRLPDLGHRWLAPVTPGQADDAWAAHRLRLGVCEGRAELGDLLWLECNAAELRGVSFTKGCYVGQENTARMHHRSKVGRRLFVLPRAEAGPRVRAIYPELGASVAHLRIDDRGDALVPPWMRGSLEG